MGMFDYIKCNYKLPLPQEPLEYKLLRDQLFQTKSLDNCLNTYMIDEKGLLWKECSEIKIIRGDENSDSFFGRIDRVETVKSWYEPEHITDTIEFYDYYQNDDNEYDYNITYKAVFIQGEIHSIEIVEFSSYCNKERKRLQAIHFEEMKVHAKFVKTKRYKYIYRPYIKSVRYVFRNTIKLIDTIKSILYKLENRLTP